jgi:hypothetical protein
MVRVSVLLKIILIYLVKFPELELKFPQQDRFFFLLDLCLLILRAVI